MTATIEEVRTHELTQFRWLPMGRSGGRHRAGFVSASGQVHVSLDTSATRDRITSSVGSPATAEQGHQFVGTRRAEPKRVQAYWDAHRPGSCGWLDLDADHAGRRPVHQPAAPPAVNSPASDGSAVPRDRAYRLAGDPSPKPPPHLDPHRVPVHPYPGPGRTEPERSYRHVMPETFFAITYPPLLLPPMSLLGLGPAWSGVWVARDAVRVQLGLGFRARIPRESVR